MNEFVKDIESQFEPLDVPAVNSSETILQNAQTLVGTVTLIQRNVNSTQNTSKFNQFACTNSRWYCIVIYFVFVFVCVCAASGAEIRAIRS